MLYRLELRNAVAQSLRETKTLAGKNVFTGLSWPVIPAKLPAIWVSAAQDRADSTGAGPPQFERIATITIAAAVSGSTPENAQKQIEQLNEEIELSLLTDYRLIRKISEVSGMQTLTELNSEAGRHIANLLMSLDLKYYETFPLKGPDLTEISGEFQDVTPD